MEMKKDIFGLMDELDYSGLVPKLKDGQRISFIEWYITFLDMEIENINESLTNSATA